MKPQYWIGLLAVAVIAFSAFFGAWRMDNTIQAPEMANVDAPHTAAVEKAVVQPLDTASLQALINSDTPPAIVDTRSQEDFIAAHIPEAVSLPAQETSAESLFAAAPYKTAPLVFYCGDATCESAEISASIAVSTGYSQVFVYREGFRAWQAKRLPVAAG